MGFMLRLHEDHTTGMVAVCDWCGKVLLAENGVVCWLFSDRKPGTTFDFKIACNDGCADILDRERGYMFTQELGTALGYLLNNTKLDVEEVRKTIALLQ